MMMAIAIGNGSTNVEHSMPSRTRAILLSYFIFYYHISSFSHFIVIFGDIITSWEVQVPNLLYLESVIFMRLSIYQEVIK